MLAFYLFSALLICFALCLLLYPILRSRRAESFVDQSDAIRARLEAVNGLYRDGVMDESAHDKAQSELSEQLMQALQAPQSNSRASMRLAVSFLALLPLAVMGLYSLVGTPTGLSFAPGPLASQAAPANQSRAAVNTSTDGNPSSTAAPDAKGNIDLAKAAEGLQARLKANPDDGEGWRLLGRTYMELGQPQDAVSALKNAIDKLPKEADLFVQYGEALGLATRPNLPPPEAEKAIDEGLALNPSHQNGLWLKGIYRRLDEDAPGAIKAWESLLAQMPPGEAMTAQLQEQINQAKSTLSGAPLTNASTPAESEVARSAVDQQESEVARSAVDQHESQAARSAVDNNESAPTASSGDTAVAAVIDDGSADLTDTTVVVNVDITPELAAKVGPNDVLFVFARAANGPPMPLAVHRQPAAELVAGKPIRITLSEANAMMPSMTLSQFSEIVIGARISKTGVANAQSGDFQALSDVQKQPLTAPLSLTITQILP
jgi:cytochrome c-type biogenesis protein CcmH